MQRAWTREEEAMGKASVALARAIARTRAAGEAYFAAPLARSMRARDAFYDALRLQADAEQAFYDAKGAISRRAPAPHTPSPAA